MSTPTQDDVDQLRQELEELSGTCAHEITQLKARVDALEAGYRRVDTRDYERSAPHPEEPQAEEP